MIKTVNSIALFVLIFNALTFAQPMKIKRDTDVFKFEGIPYFVSNPLYLRRGDVSNDTLIAMYANLKHEIEKNLVTKCRTQTWYLIDEDINQRMTIGFNLSAASNNGKIDTLPYATWDYCATNKMSRFAAFYLYLINQRTDVKQGGAANVSIPLFVPNVHGGTAGRAGSVPVSNTGSIHVGSLDFEVDVEFNNIQLCLALFDVKTNRCVFNRCTDDDDYRSVEEMVEELFEKFDLEEFEKSEPGKH